MESRRLACQNLRCKYEWLSKSKMLVVTCPSCGMKVKTTVVQ